MWRGGGLSISRYKCRVVWRGGGGSSITKHSEIYAASEGRGLRGVDHEMFQDLLAVVSMHISEPQSRTVPMYIAFWQLHSLLYLEKLRDIWDSVECNTHLDTQRLSQRVQLVKTYRKSKENVAQLLLHLS